MTDNPAVSRMRARGQNDLDMQELLTPEPLTAQAVVDAIYQGADVAPEAMDPVLKDMLEPPVLVGAIPEDNILDDIEIVEKDASALQGPLQGDESKGGAMSSPGVRAKRFRLVSAKKKKKSKEVAPSRTVKEYISPRPVTAFEKLRWGIRRKEYGLGTTIRKGDDGLRLAYIVTSNAYQDRETEWVTTKALTGYVEKSWDGEECQPNNLYLFWHSAEAVGDIVWADMQGPFLIEVAKERPNRPVNIAREGQEPVVAMIKEVWDYIEENPDNLDWGASQGFKASPKEVKTKNYRDIRKFETSSLPLDKAANAYTFTGVVDVKSRDQILEKITGVKGSSKQVKNLRETVDTTDAVLQRLGIRHKDLGEVEVDKGMIEDLTEEVEKFLGEIIDGDEDVIKEVAPEVVEAIMQTMAGEKNKKRKKEDTSKENQGAGDADDNTDDDQNVGTGGYRKDGYSYSDPDASLHPIAKDLKRVRKDLKKVADIPELLMGFGERLEQVEKQLSLRPRSVSRDTTGGSVVNPGDGSLIAAIEKQLTEKDDFFGVHVRPQ